MNLCYILQICVIFSFLITSIFGRALYYDDLNDDDDDNSKFSSNEDEEIEVRDHESKFLNSLNDNNKDDDSLSYDSYEEKQYHQRAILSTSRAPHTLSPHTRQAIIDMLQKAFDEGWRPNLKHYIPSTRFGRHRR